MSLSNLALQAVSFRGLRLWGGGGGGGVGGREGGGAAGALNPKPFMNPKP